MTPVGRSGRNDQDLLGVYLHEVAQHPLLTRDDEVALARAIEAGRAAGEVLGRAKAGAWPLEPAEEDELLRRASDGDAATLRFTQGNLRLVVAIAKKYQRSGVPILDLVQDGNLGLIRAVERFDWRKGFKFSTYATWWIRQGISRGILESGRTIRLPVSAASSLGRVDQVRTELATALGRAATRAEILAAADLSAARYDEIIPYLVGPRSLSEPTGADQDGELWERVADQSGPSPFDQAASVLLGDEVEKLLTVLDDRERMILRLRFGLQGETACTLEEIGHIVCLTRERVRQIEGRAMEKLRACPGHAAAREFLT